jgi:plasmid stabilization system protein ParE
VKPERFDLDAREEFLAAVDWYAARDPNVARRFVKRVAFAIEQIRAAPHTFPLAPFVPERLGIRKRNVEGFPYSVVFLELETEGILALAHGRRRPGYWRARFGEK